MILDTDSIANGTIHIWSWAFSIKAMVTAATLAVLTLIAIWGLRRLVDRARRSVGEKRAGAIYVGGQVARYLLVVIGVMATISALGIDLSTLSLFAGALGVGIGLGLQDVVKNFVCGLILMFDGSIEVGDYIELEDGTSGAVVAIGPRAATLLTADNVDILVPNSDLIGGKLTNWTRNRGSRRIHIPFSVAYGANKELVKEAAIEAAHSVSFTMPDVEGRRTQVWLVGFGDSALDFELVVWPSLAAVKRPGSMMAAYRWALDDYLQKYGIEIPFPQRDLRIRTWFGTEDENARNAWHGRETTSSTTTQSKCPSSDLSNDAAMDITESL